MEKHLKKIRPSHTSDINQFLNLPPPTEIPRTDTPDIIMRSAEAMNIHSKRTRQQFERQTVIPSYLRTRKKPRNYVV